MSVKCQACGRMVSGTVAKCECCGAKLTMRSCSACGREVSAQAASCPACGQPLTVPFEWRWYHWLFIGFGALLLFLGAGLLINGCVKISQGYWTSFRSDEALMVAVFLCGGIFAVVAPFCRRRKR